MDDDDLWGWAFRHDGEQRAKEHTPWWWAASFYLGFWELWEKGEDFGLEDVREYCGDPPAAPQAYSAYSAAVLRRAFKENLIILVEHTYTKRPKSHKCDKKIYRPLPNPNGNGQGKGIQIDTSGW
jgi:hypothetical protein